MIKHALTYAKNGWRVLPVWGVSDGFCHCPMGEDCDKKPGKHPIETGWQKKATTDERTIDGWWGKWSDANIGVATGKDSGIFVFDVDGEVGVRSLEVLEEEHGEFPETLICRTGSGGLHYFFAFPADFEVRNKQSLRPGIDIRGEGGFVVAAPSEHESGSRYEWIKRAPIAEAPAWLLSLLRPSVDLQPYTAKPITGDLAERATKYLQKMEPAIQGSNGSGATLKAAIALVKGFRMSESDALSLMVNVYNPRCTPAWSEKELLHKVKDAGNSKTPAGYIIDNERVPMPREKAWDRLVAPPIEAPPLNAYDEEITAATQQAELTERELETALDNDKSAALREPLFSRLLGMRDLPEWQLMTDVLRAKKALQLFKDKAKKADRIKAKNPVIDKDNWESSLTYRKNKDGEESLENCFSNIVIILENHPDWIDVIGYDDFSQRISVVGTPPFERHSDRWEDSDVLDTKLWLERNFFIRPPTAMIHEAVLAVAKHKTFNPLKNYVNSLEDQGRSALDTWLTDYFGVEDTPYTRAVGAKWMISAIARAYIPGIKVDTVLILEGKQGLKKSRVLSQLCPDPEWFADGLSDFGSKAQAEEIEGKWIIELAELKGFGREINQVKAFVTRTAENYRPAYGRNAIRSERKCVFAGTVNPGDGQYFKDDENRRFWPVKCTKLAPELTPAMRDQLWAEAKSRYLAGEKWFFVAGEDDELINAAVVEQKNRVELDVWHELVERHVVGVESTSVDELLSDVIKIETAKKSQKEANRVARILVICGFSRYQHTWPGGRRTWRYRRGLSQDSLPLAPRLALQASQ